jgi:hypothetical protein
MWGYPPSECRTDAVPYVANAEWSCLHTRGPVHKLTTFPPFLSTEIPIGSKSQREVERERWIMDEVREILTMFRALRGAYDSLSDKDGIDQDLITFDGFDGDN